MIKIKACNFQTGSIQEKTLTAEFKIQSECIIGRHPSCDLVLNSPEVSRVHGRILFQDGQSYLSDLGSTDGTRINGKQANVNQKYALQNGDLIQIGEFVLQMEAVKETLASSGNARFLAGVDRDLSWTEGDLKVRCVQVIDETADVRTFCFVAEPPVLFTYKPGQFVILKLEIDEKPVQRCYSISSTPSRPHTLEITVKRASPTESAPNVPPGLVSNWLHDNITVGSQVKLSGPMGEFTCDASEGKKLLMISGALVCYCVVE